MIKRILQIGSPILTEKTEKVVDPKSPQSLDVISDLMDTILNDTDATAGLAAPQIGHKLAICVCRRTDLEEKFGEENVEVEDLWEIMINPSIVKESKQRSVFWEGCLSIGEGPKQLFGPVSRPSKVKIDYLSPSGERKSLDAEGFFAHVVQHEIDHLNGILFLNYVQNPANIWTSKNLDDYIKQHDTYPPIEA